jgi:Straboviridae homing endonuclease
MNYLKIYESLIKEAKKKNRKKLRKTNENYVYYENHHILPKCIGGLNNKENLILLTPKEHYLAHKLLVRIYKGNRKIALAYHRMTFDKKNNYHISARDYDFAKKLISLIPCSEETRKKQSDKKIGSVAPVKGRKVILKNGKRKYVFPSEISYYVSEGWTFKVIKPKNKYKHSEDTKELIRKNALGRKATKKTKEILSKSHLGISPGNKGKIAIYKNNEKTYIQKTELDTYLQNGWNCKNPYKRKNKTTLT